MLGWSINLQAARECEGGQTSCRLAKKSTSQTLPSGLNAVPSSLKSIISATMGLKTSTSELGCQRPSHKQIAPKAAGSPRSTRVSHASVAVRSQQAVSVPTSAAAGYAECRGHRCSWQLCSWQLVCSSRHKRVVCS